MPNAYIYKLLHKDGPFVIGSTNNYKNRMKNHKKSIKEGNSDFQKYVRENGGWENVTSEILKEWNCIDSSEILKEEGKFIDEVYEDPLCFNMKTAGITPKSPIGKLYKLTIGEYCYFGRCRNDYHRFASHKNKSKTSNTKLYKKIRELGGWENVNIEMVKEWVCSDSELKDAEDELIRNNWNEETILNSMPASTTPEREKELSNARVKKWVESHPEEAKESSRIRSQRWRETHPEKATEVQQKYNEKRKSDPKRKEYNKEYYEKNREELNRKKREKRALEKLNKNIIA